MEFLFHHTVYSMANTRRKRLPGEIVMDSPPRKRGRPQTRPERTTPNRPYKKVDVVQKKGKQNVHFENHAELNF